MGLDLKSEQQKSKKISQSRLATAIGQNQA